MNDTADVLIIGAGPAGLTAAAALAARINGRVLVLEREATGGGIPRHSDHPGYGIRDLHRFMSGPAYARRLVATAQAAGAELQTETMVTGWAGEHTVETTSPTGRRHIHAPSIILATGARERPRAARLVAGDRAAGTYTTGQLQNLVHLHHQSPGTRAVIAGAELVSWSAAMTLREAGCKPLLMTSTHPKPESYAAFSIPGRYALGIEVATRTRVARVIGHGRVTGIEIEQLDTHARRTIDCDTIIFTGDWIPDNELARSAGPEMDPNTHGPVIDTRQATSRPGVFAIGNLSHPVDTADVAALDGRVVANQVLAYLRKPSADAADEGPRVLPGRGLKWITPGILRPGVTAPRSRLLAWPTTQTSLPTVGITQDRHQIACRRLPWPASPGRIFRIPTSILKTIDLAGGPISIDLLNADVHPTGHEIVASASSLRAV
jgi:thioredoxin reductase